MNRGESKSQVRRREQQKSRKKEEMSSFRVGRERLHGYEQEMRENEVFVEV